MKLKKFLGRILFVIILLVLSYGLYVNEMTAREKIKYIKALDMLMKKEQEDKLDQWFKVNFPDSLERERRRKNPI